MATQLGLPFGTARPSLRDLRARLRIAADCEAAGESFERLVELDAEAGALAREHGSFAAALAAVERRLDLDRRCI